MSCLLDCAIVSLSYVNCNIFSLSFLTILLLWKVAYIIKLTIIMQTIVMNVTTR